MAFGLPQLPVTSLVRHAAFACALDALDVFVERATSGFERRGGPSLAALGEFGFGDLDVDDVFLSVERDLVARLHQRNRTAALGLGADMADNETVAAAREAAVGDEGDVGAEAGAHDGARGR